MQIEEKIYNIIKANSQHHSPVSWWPKFAYHYTDVNNIVSILSSGKLYSRANADELNLMQNDNASRQVIDMTNADAKMYVRLYFRPLTPTQYHNEGFKHPQLRYDNDRNADVPVPVFLLFNMDKLLTASGVMFSEKSLAGYGSELLSDIDDFSRFDFDKIYSNSWKNYSNELIKYRHAEILYPNFFEIDDYLNVILCRNGVEKTTLINMLKGYDINVYEKYKSKIRICRSDMFENNGLFLTGCQYIDNSINIRFSDSFSRNAYTDKQLSHSENKSLSPIIGKMNVLWKLDKHVLNHVEVQKELDYRNTSAINYINVPVVDTATSIEIKYYINNHLMCYIEQPLEIYEPF